jgi:hypothetical protein
MTADPNKKYKIGEKVPESGTYECFDSVTDKLLDSKHHDQQDGQGKEKVFPPKPDIGGKAQSGDCYYKWSKKS